MTRQPSLRERHSRRTATWLRSPNVPSVSASSTSRTPRSARRFGVRCATRNSPRPCCTSSVRRRPRRSSANRCRAAATTTGTCGAATKISAAPPAQCAPHRGGAILALGLIGMLTSFCVLPGWILGGIAASMAATDMQRMARGSMDNSGRGLTQGGQVCGIIALIISTLTFLFACLARVGQM